MTNQQLDDVLTQIVVPPQHSSQPIRRVEGEFIHRLVQDRNLINTLEVGLACGYSAACIMSGHAQVNGKHTSIDPFQKSHFDNQGLENLETLGYRNRLEFHEDYSHHALPRLHEQGRQFDFVFIDGDHRLDHIFVDFHYVNLMLAVGGYVLLHDGWLRSTQMMSSFIRRNRKEYQLIRKTDRNLVLFQKTDQPDDRDWHHFREFYTLKGFFSQRVISWLLRTGHIDRFFPR